MTDILSRISHFMEHSLTANLSDSFPPFIQQAIDERDISRLFMLKERIEEIFLDAQNYARNSTIRVRPKAENDMVRTIEQELETVKKAIEVLMGGQQGGKDLAGRGEWV